MARIFFQNTSLFRLKQARSATMRASKQTMHVCNALLQQCGRSMRGCNGLLHVRINLMRRSTSQCMFITTRCTNATAQCEFTTTCCKNAPSRYIAAVSHCSKTSLEKRLQRLIVTIHQGDRAIPSSAREPQHGQAEAADPGKKINAADHALTARMSGRLRYFWAQSSPQPTKKPLLI